MVVDDGVDGTVDEYQYQSVRNEQHILSSHLCKANKNHSKKTNI